MKKIVPLLMLAVILAGCQTTFRTVDERFMAQPAAHRHVQVLPVWFEGAGNIDRSLSTNDLQVLCRQSGKDLVRTIRRELQSKGYEVVGPVQLWQGDQSSAGWGTGFCGPLETVQMDLCENLLQQFPFPADGRPLTFQTNTALGFFRYLATWSPARFEHNPFHYQMTSSLTNVLFWMGATNSEAVLLVDTKAFFESEHKHTQRVVWNWTGGGLLATAEVGVNLAILAAAVLVGADSAPVPVWVDPFWRSDNSLQHNIALVDVQTREVLWLNRREFKHKDPRDAEILADTVVGTLADLPRVP